MADLSPRALRAKLIEKGFKTIDLCDTCDGKFQDDIYYMLSKNDEIAKPDACVMLTVYDLQSEEALGILEKWMSKIHITPDPSMI